MEKTAIGGYYPFPPVPNTFSKYCKNTKGTAFHCKLLVMPITFSDILLVI